MCARYYQHNHFLFHENFDPAEADHALRYHQRESVSPAVTSIQDTRDEATDARKTQFPQV